MIRPNPSDETARTTFIHPGIAHVGDVMAGLFAPHRNDLGHDAGEIGMHDTCEPGMCRAFGGEVDDADPKLTQERGLLYRVYRKNEAAGP